SGPNRRRKGDVGAALRARLTPGAQSGEFHVAPSYSCPLLIIGGRRSVCNLFHNLPLTRRRACVRLQAMVVIHHLLSNMIGLYSLLLGGWSLINYLRRRPPDGSFNGALAIAVGLYALEGLVGVVLVLTGLMPPRW